MAQGGGRGEKRTVGQRSRKLEQAFHSTVKYALRGSPMDEFETYFPQGSVPAETLGAVYDAYVQVGVLLVGIWMCGIFSMLFGYVYSVYIRLEYLSTGSLRRFAKMQKLQICCRPSMCCVQSKGLMVHGMRGWFCII